MMKFKMHVLFHTTISFRCKDRSTAMKINEVSATGHSSSYGLTHCEKWRPGRTSLSHSDILTSLTELGRNMFIILLRSQSVIKSSHFCNPSTVTVKAPVKGGAVKFHTSV